LLLLAKGAQLARVYTRRRTARNIPVSLGVVFCRVQFFMDESEAARPADSRSEATVNGEARGASRLVGQ